MMDVIYNITGSWRLTRDVVINLIVINSNEMHVGLLELTSYGCMETHIPGRPDTQRSSRSSLIIL